MDDLDRGLVDYFAGQYAVSVQVLDRYLAQAKDDDGTAHYYKGLSLREIGAAKYPLNSDSRSAALSAGGIPEEQAALSEWNVLIRDHSTSRFWTDAWDEIAYTQWVYQDQPGQAAQTLLNFVSTDPKEPQSAGVLIHRRPLLRTRQPARRGRPLLGTSGG